MTGEEVREKWAQSWQDILQDPVSRAGREEKGPDQTLLTLYVWPWGSEVAMEHDSYT